MHRTSNAVAVNATLERWPLRYPFRITGYEWTQTEVLVVEVESSGLRGRGEACGVYYKNDTPESALAQVREVSNDLAGGAGRRELQALLPPGGARNALDCALWDLEAKHSGTPVWRLAGLESPRPLLTTYTLGADVPETMAQRARDFAGARALKLKLTGDGNDKARVLAVRAARPDVWLAVDANQGFTAESLEQLMPALTAARVELIEQPFPIGREGDLDGFESEIPIAADESAQSMADLAGLVGRFKVVNIKLDKCGGLTHALEMEAEARRLGLKVMVGNMSGTSLAMAPAFVLGQRCDVTDLDGPLVLQRDRQPGVSYERGCIWCPEEVWGAGAIR